VGAQNTYIATLVERKTRYVQLVRVTGKDTTTVITALIRRVQQGMGSQYYAPGPLGRSEVCLRSFAGKLRRLIPETRLDAPPPPGWSGLPAA